MTLRQNHCKPQPSTQTRRQASGPHPLHFVLLALLFVLSGMVARAETLNVRMSVVSLNPARVKIEGEREGATRAWSFRNIYAGAINLGERIENLVLTDAGGAQVAVKKPASGEYQAVSDATRFSYEMKLDAPLWESDAAHVSWLTGEDGLFMLGDLLPLTTNDEKRADSSAVVIFNLPDSWTIASNLHAVSEGRFQVKDVERAVFFVGRNLRQKQQRVGALELAFVTTGEWAFSDEELMKMAADILKDHAQTFGGVPGTSAMLMLAPFPRPAAADHWSAETRGSTVLLLSGKSPSRTAALAQLSFPLAHELFHLWIPNGLKLDGDYDWFYEGFTLYQALRAGLRLELLTFQDYLNALGRAFDAYKSAREGDKLSLLDASSRRWTTQPALVYNKGMLVAFLYDLTLRQQSKGKRSLDDVYRELFRLYQAPGARKDGNAAVLNALNGAGEMRELTRRYVETASAIDLASAIAPFGLQVDQIGAKTRVVVSPSLSGAQRDLLRKFGYNEKTYGVVGHRAGGGQIIYREFD